MSDGRRDFLKKMAKGTLYAVPLMHTLAAPRGLRAQGKDQGGGDNNKGVSTEKNKGWSGMQAIEQPVETGFSPSPPWSKPPGG